ncbi:MAG: hypothetical protein JNJ98_14275 [Gemmatimonadetes bacterium]|nr:hypothetical protein [Gemmatimonadota bacterium]
MTRICRVLALVIAVASPLTVHAQPTLNSLQQQVQRLMAAQRRVDTLLAQLDARVLALEAEAEKVDPEDALAKQEEDNKEKLMANLERRLAALERNPSAGKGRGDAPAGSRVRAPFVVEDDDGDVIMRVVGGKSPRLFIGNEKGGNIEFGTGAAGGGVMRVRDGDGDDRITLVGSQGHGEIRVASDKQTAVLTSGLSYSSAALRLIQGDTPTAVVGAGSNGNGHMTLSSASGEIVVLVGLNTDGVGMVKVGPAQRTSGLGPQSVLLGAKARK